MPRKAQPKKTAAKAEANPDNAVVASLSPQPAEPRDPKTVELPNGTKRTDY